MYKKIAALLLVFMLLMCANSVLAQGNSETNKLKELAKITALKLDKMTLEPNEINAIAYRRKLMGKPGLQLYVVFFNDMGQPIDYFVTAGKCSSSNKRLTKPWKFENGQTGKDSDGNAVYGDFVVPAMAEDGTNGQSDNYIHCTTIDGKYKQWNGRYYVSDAPIEITIKPLVVEFSNKNQQQQ